MDKKASFSGRTVKMIIILIAILVMVGILYVTVFQQFIP